MRKGSESELVSNFTRAQFQDLKFKPGIASGSDGQPLASLEMVTVINLASVDNPEGINVTVRGLPPAGIEMRRERQARDAAAGSRPGKREVVVGQVDRGALSGSAASGKKIRFGRGDWDVVGVMDAGPRRAGQRDLGRPEPGERRLPARRSAQLRAGARHRRGGRQGAGQRHQQRSAAEHERASRRRNTTRRRPRRRRPSSSSGSSCRSSWRWAAASPP